MACASCEQRRRMIAEALRKGGYLGAVKKIPHVSLDLLKNPPKRAKPK